MAKLIFGFWFLCALVLQVNSMEIVNGFDNTTEIEANEEFRFLFSGLACHNPLFQNKCRAKLATTSTVLPRLPVTLTRLSNNRLYFFSPAAPAAMLASFDNAAKFCRDHGMSLVTINSQRENELVFSEAVLRGLAGTTGTGAWIGLRDATLASMFKWILNGQANNFNFFNAAPAAGTCVQYVTATASSPANSWVGSACATVLPFICELEAPCGLIL